MLPEFFVLNEADLRMACLALASHIGGGVMSLYDMELEDLLWWLEGLPKK